MGVMDTGRLMKREKHMTDNATRAYFYLYYLFSDQYADGPLGSKITCVCDL